MAATIAQLIPILATNASVSNEQAEAVLVALAESYGEWMKAHGADGNGVFNGSDGNFDFNMGRVPPPGAHWILKVEPKSGFLTTYGDDDERFGLQVTND